MLRRCSRCDQHLPSESFSRSAQGRDGLHSYCKACMSAYSRAARPRTIHPAQTCPICAKSFVPKSRPATYCSPNCKQTGLYRRRNPKIKRACQVCGSDITERRRDVKWCSEACSRKGRPQVRAIVRRSRLKTQYGLTPEAYDAMLAAQGGVCAICRGEKINGFGKRLAVDHDEGSGRVRGILCGNCNRGIGHFDHDPNLLVAAISYLKET